MKNKKLWVFIGLVVCILILNHVFGWSSYFSDMNNLSFLTEMVQDNLVIAVLIYIIITIVGCVVLALPGVTFAIFAGVLFGPFLGTICCSLATTIGATFAFLAGRFFLQDSVKPMVMKNEYLKKWLFSGKDKNMLFVLMITRLVPLFPYNLQNFAYGITDIRFSAYAIGSLVFMLPGTAMYTIGAAGITDAENRLTYIIIAVILAVIVMGLGYIFRKRYIGEE